MLKRLKPLSLPVVFGFLFLGCVKSDVEEIPKNAVVVDVRTPREFAGWHYPGSVNIPLDEIEKRADELGDKDRPIVLY